MKVHRLQAKTDSDVKAIQDKLFKESKDGNRNFYGLLELAKSPAIILTAIHKIKANKGSNTPGTDGQKIKDFLEMDYDDVILAVQSRFTNYTPEKIRRKLIPKPGKSDLRPLGIPAMIDRIVQEVIRSVIEPILEAQFFDHSYGFRPMRDASHAIARVHHILWQAKCTWAIEGDIKGFFDNIDHNILLKKLWKMGIKDKRILMIIKKMLKAGILGEIETNPLGTPQGGIISPLLANVYLHDFDEFVASHWEAHPEIANYKDKWAFFTVKTRPKFRQQYPRYYLIRYADDWIILTDSEENAVRMRKLAGQFLERNGKLQLSAEKTLITNACNKPLTFLGIETKVGNSRKGKGKVTYSKPSAKAIKFATKNLRAQAKKISKAYFRDRTVQEINRFNSMVVGIGNYWSMTSQVTKFGSRVDHRLWYSLDKILRNLTGTRAGEYHLRKIEAKETSNLPVRHAGRSTKVPFILFEGCKIGITMLAFSNYVIPSPKIPAETPHTPEGRKIYSERSGKKQRLARPDEITLLDNIVDRVHSAKGSQSKSIYTFEYWMNRGYVLNRDKCQCAVCKVPLDRGNLHTHHKNPFLPLDLVNKVRNLVSLCVDCHELVHNDRPNPFENPKLVSKLESYRQLVMKVS
jgi:group II intron reverse transcriptase/maturase